MARGTTLANLVIMLRGRTGNSLDANHGKNKDAVMKQMLRQEQMRLYDEWDWPHLRGAYDKVMSAGSRYYDLPVEPESIEKVEVKYGDVWLPLPRGISGEEYNLYDPSEDERSDPVQKWDYYIHPTDDALIDNEQFEVWPLPATDSLSTVRFWGKRALPALDNDADRAILDDLMIVLYAAAAMESDRAKSEKLLGEANARFSRLKGRSRKRSMFRLGGEDKNPEPRRPGPVRVVLTGD